MRLVYRYIECSCSPICVPPSLPHSPPPPLPLFAVYTNLLLTQPLLSTSVEDVDGDYIRCRWAENSLDECGAICRSIPASLDERNVGHSYTTDFYSTCN